ncbi:MAG: NUDIX domain-containing protein [bacterium]|nr:NUDIX domain-containing protein [bacterium]
MPVVRISAKALICRDRRLLVIENHNPELFYTLPGGGQESGETLPDTLRRECREELQMEIEVHDLIFARDYIAAHHEFAHLHPDFHQVELIFDCSPIPGARPAPGLRADEHQTGFRWLPASEIEEAPLYPRDMRAALAEYCAESERPFAKAIYLGDIN